MDKQVMCTQLRCTRLPHSRSHTAESILLMTKRSSNVKYKNLFGSYKGMANSSKLQLVVMEVGMQKRVVYTFECATFSCRILDCGFNYFFYSLCQHHICSTEFPFDFSYIYTYTTAKRDSTYIVILESIQKIFKFNEHSNSSKYLMLL